MGQKMARGRVVLAKHAQPTLDPAKPAREWSLAVEGEAQAKRLAEYLRRYIPCRLVSSPEPKASRTSRIVADELRIPMKTVAGLREIDRRVLPIVSQPEHERRNARLFVDFDRKILGSESAREAQTRFTAALLNELHDTVEDNLVVVAHGTVIALFVSAHNSVDATELWMRLQCPSFVVLERSSFALVEVVSGITTADRFREDGA